MKAIELSCTLSVLPDFLIMGGFRGEAFNRQQLSWLYPPVISTAIDNRCPFTFVLPSALLHWSAQERRWWSGDLVFIKNKNDTLEIYPSTTNSEQYLILHFNIIERNLLIKCFTHLHLCKLGGTQIHLEVEDKGLILWFTTWTFTVFSS